MIFYVGCKYRNVGFVTTRNPHEVYHFSLRIAEVIYGILTHYSFYQI